MPFPMAHLYIAKKILDTNPVIKDPAAFYLGSLAPDCVHFRPNYTSDYKKVSHLCVSDERWGMVTNNEEWIINVLDFFYARKNSADIDFYYGYCAHIISDILINIYSWMPFRLKYQPELDKGGVDIHHMESNVIDKWLYQTNKHNDEIWLYLKASRGIDIHGIATSAEIHAIRDNILYTQYCGIETVDPSGNTIVTADYMLEFIDGAAAFVIERLMP